MASAWLTLQQHALDISTSAPEMVLNLCTHTIQPARPTRTLDLLGVDVSLSFEQLDGNIDIPTGSSYHQRRAMKLGTHNDILRDRMGVCGHPSS